MTMFKFFSFSLYFLGVVIFFNSSSRLFTWILIEINLISFVLVSLDPKDYVNNTNCSFLLFYFLVQSRATLLFLSSFFCENFLGFLDGELMFVIGIIMKIGLFPLFFWVFLISDHIGITRLILLLTIQKIPLFMILFSSDSFLLYIVIFLSFLSGSLIVFFSQSLPFLIISSSVSYSLVLYLFFIIRPWPFFRFFFVYRLFLSLIFFQRNFWRLGEGGVHKFLMVMSFCFFAGLPPIGLFFYKILFTLNLFSFFSQTELFFFWAIRCLSLVGYTKFFYSFLYNFNSLYISNLSATSLYLFLPLLILSLGFIL